MLTLNSNRLSCLLFAVITLIYSQFGFAAGVPANTIITNTVTANYVLGGVSGSVSTNSSFTVQELLDVSLLWQDASNVPAMSPGNNVIIRFELVNTGNGFDQYLLSVDGDLPGDDFDIAPADFEIWIDDDDGIWSAATDTLYVDPNGPTLNGGDAVNDSITIFVVADVQGGLTIGDLSNLQLTATSSTANAAGQTGVIGAEIIGAGDGGVNANVGFSGATANATSIVEIVSSGVAINKSVIVIDTLGGSDPHTGATLRYALDVQISGSRTINNLVIVDPIPNVTTYTAGSIRLNASAQTDAQDVPADFSDFNISNTNSITVDLSEGGTASIAPPQNFIIEFEVTID